MKMYIPEIGDQIKLTSDWVFPLHREYRNARLLTILRGENVSYDSTKKPFSVTMSVGTILQIDRVYIRRGGSDFSSVTFIIKNGEQKGVRFWAKLKDVNTLDFEIVLTDPNKSRKKTIIWIPWNGPRLYTYHYEGEKLVPEDQTEPMIGTVDRVQRFRIEGLEPQFSVQEARRSLSSFVVGAMKSWNDTDKTQVKYFVKFNRFALYDGDKLLSDKIQRWQSARERANKILREEQKKG